MPIRIGKTMRRVLTRMATDQRQGIRVNFLLDELTTCECKAIRQLSSEQEKEHKRVGPESAALARRDAAMGANP